MTKTKFKIGDYVTPISNGRIFRGELLIVTGYHLDKVYSPAWLITVKDKQGIEYKFLEFILCFHPHRVAVLIKDVLDEV